MQDLTQGSITRHLIRYAIPMILGNYLQLTYNAVDSIIVGKQLGETALAAVSTSNPIITILVLGASGVSLGASVVIGKFKGARDEQAVRHEFATTMIFGVFFSLAILLLGLFLSEPMLRLTRTPAEVLPESVAYLQMYLLGFPFTFLYNALSSCLRGIGDSRTPVHFLTLSCVMNILLDWLLIMVIPMGVRGAALATVISQVVAAITCWIYIEHKVPDLHLERKDWRVDSALLKETLQIGSLTALQQAAQPIGKTCIQSVINDQGIIAIDAFNAATKIDDYARIPTQSIGNSVMACVAQNRGAKQEERIIRSFRQGVLIALCYFPIIVAITQLIKIPAITLLSPAGSTEIIAAGVSYLSIKSFFIIGACTNNAIQGYFRGMGRMRIVLMGTVIQVSVRVLCVYLWVPKIGINGEAYATFVGWFCQFAVEYALYFYEKRKRALAKQ